MGNFLKRSVNIVNHLRYRVEPTIPDSEGRQAEFINFVQNSKAGIKYEPVGMDSLIDPFFEKFTNESAFVFDNLSQLGSINSAVILFLLSNKIVFQFDLLGGIYLYKEIVPEEGLSRFLIKVAIL